MEANTEKIHGPKCREQVTVEYSDLNKDIYITPLLPNSGIVAEEGAERLQDPEAVHGYKETVLSAHS